MMTTSFEPLEVVLKKTSRSVGYACPLCGAFYSSMLFGGGPAGCEQAKKVAEAHCFSGEVPSFEKAEKISLEDYPEGHPLFWAERGLLISLDDLLDRCEEEEVDVPQYVWAAKELNGWRPDFQKAVVLHPDE